MPKHSNNDNNNADPPRVSRQRISQSSGSFFLVSSSSRVLSTESLEYRFSVLLHHLSLLRQAGGVHSKAVVAVVPRHHGRPDLEVVVDLPLQGSHGQDLHVVPNLPGARHDVLLQAALVVELDPRAVLFGALPAVGVLQGQEAVQEVQRPVAVPENHDPGVHGGERADLGPELPVGADEDVHAAPRGGDQLPQVPVDLPDHHVRVHPHDIVPAPRELVPRQLVPVPVARVPRLVQQPALEGRVPEPVQLGVQRVDLGRDEEVPQGLLPAGPLQDLHALAEHLDRLHPLHARRDRNVSTALLPLLLLCHAPQREQVAVARREGGPRVGEPREEDAEVVVDGPVL
mmetsp:Transcript_7112/g.20745  ORF Transcript_7112/g.20745 Transcript_7112/m.20745 type:complete len:343 (+) Transcript_7112:205-1233(+)